MSGNMFCDGSASYLHDENHLNLTLSNRLEREKRRWTQEQLNSFDTSLIACYDLKKTQALR